MSQPEGRYGDRVAVPPSILAEPDAPLVMPTVLGPKESTSEGRSKTGKQGDLEPAVVISQARDEPLENTGLAMASSSGLAPLLPPEEVKPPEGTLERDQPVGSVIGGAELGQQPNIFQEIFTYDTALPRAPEHPEGVSVRAGLSTISGVYLPCCQNILGVIVFLRLSWLVGVGGALEAFQIVFTCCLITFTTSVSMAAIATNGPVPAGGAYYMINRCLGPEFGGAVGILFYLGTTIGSSMYVIGAVEILLIYLVKEPMILRVFPDLEPNDPSNILMNFRVYGTILLLGLAVVVFFGVLFVTKFAIIALICVIGALFCIFAGIFVNSSGNEDWLICVVGKRVIEHVAYELCNYKGLKDIMCKDGSCDPYYEEHKDEITLAQAFPGMSSNTLFDTIFNLYASPDDYASWSYDRYDYAAESDKSGYQSEAWIQGEETYHFLVLLGIFFPSTTGIMAGSNRSGDLKKPQHAIPLGTMGAIITTSIIYLTMVVFYAGSVHRLLLLDKYGKSLSPGGGMVVSFISIPAKTGFNAPTVTEVGALLSTVGAGLQSLTGAPRLLQAIAKDGFIPLLNPLAVLSNQGEPFRALLVTVAISEIGILIGALDLIAPLLSMFFLLFYAGVNVACTVMSLSANPGWRPSFRYYHWSVSLVGVCLCVGTMFSIDYKLALLALGIFSLCFYGIKFFGGVQEWGAGVRGLALSFATQSLIRVSKTYGQVKYWRPQILHVVSLRKRKVQLMTGVAPQQEDKTGRENSPISSAQIQNEMFEWRVKTSDIQLFNLGSQIKQGAGLAIGGCSVFLDTRDKVTILNKLKVMIQQTMRKQGLDGLAEVAVSTSNDLDGIRNATSSLIQLTGLGVLRPNTIMVRFPRKNDVEEYECFKRILEEAVAYEVALIVPVGGIRTWDGIRGSKEVGYIDMVLLNQNDTGLLLMVAYLIHNHPMWRRSRLRVLIPIPTKDADKKAFSKTKKTWEKYLEKVRIDANLLVFACNQNSRELNNALRSDRVKSSNTKLTLMSMRRDPETPGSDEEILPHAFDLDAWLLQCRIRIRKMENCIFLWNAGMAVISE